MEILIILVFQAVINAGIFVYLQRRLLLQNVALRQQLSVYLRTVDNKKIKHKIKNRDRFMWIVLFKVWPEWKNYLFFKKYVAYYNRARPSQAIHAIPDPYPDIDDAKPCSGTIVGSPVLGGLHHDYRLVA